MLESNKLALECITDTNKLYYNKYLYSPLGAWALELILFVLIQLFSGL